MQANIVRSRHDGLPCAYNKRHERFTTLLVNIMDENQEAKSIEPEQPKTGGNTPLPLLIPEGIRYNCQGCGRCCSGWSVGLTEADYSRVKDVDWGSLHPDLKDRELFIHREQEFKDQQTMYPHFTNPRADGTCPFLIDNLCFIHGQFEEATKPGTCQIFPYSFVQTPTAIYMGVAYNSMASVRNIGDLLTDQREKLEGYWDKTVHHLGKRANPNAAPETPGNPFDEVVLTGGCVVPWKEYLHLDNKLLALLKNAEKENIPFIETLIKGEELILEAIKLAKNGKSLSELDNFEPKPFIPAEPSSSGIYDTIIAMVYYLYLVYPTIRIKYKDLWQLKKKSALNPVFLSQLTRQIAEYTSSGISTIMFKQASLPDFGKNELVKSLSHPIKPFTPEMNAFFCRWLYVKIFAKTYFGPVAAGYSVLSGYNSLTACFICSQIFVKGETRKRKTNEILIADLYEAYWRLDREFLTVDQILPQVSNGMSLAYSVPKVFRNLLAVLAKSMSVQ